MMPMRNTCLQSPQLHHVTVNKSLHHNVKCLAKRSSYSFPQLGVSILSVSCLRCSFSLVHNSSTHDLRRMCFFEHNPCNEPIIDVLSYIINKMCLYHEGLTSAIPWVGHFNETIHRVCAISSACSPRLPRNTSS